MSLALSIDPGSISIKEYNKIFSSLSFITYSEKRLRELYGVSCRSSLGVVTACLLCAFCSRLGSRRSRSGWYGGETCAPSYDALNLNLFLSHGRPACLAPYSGQPRSRNYVTRVRQGGSHREPPYRKSGPRFVSRKDARSAPRGKTRERT